MEYTEIFSRSVHKCLFGGVLFLLLLSATVAKAETVTSGDKQKTFGTIHTNNNHPVSFATISLHDPTTNTRTHVTVADAIGRYFLFAPNTAHTMHVRGTTLSHHPIDTRTTITPRDGVVVEDVVVQDGG